MDTRYDFRGREDETWYDLDQDLAFFLQNPLLLIKWLAALAKTNKFTSRIIKAFNIII